MTQRAYPRLTPGLQEATVAQPAATAELTKLLNRYGVAVVLGATYEWAGYPYSSAADAIAAARRDQAREMRR